MKAQLLNSFYAASNRIITTHLKMASVAETVHVHGRFIKNVGLARKEIKIML